MGIFDSLRCRILIEVKWAGGKRKDEKENRDREEGERVKRVRELRDGDGGRSGGQD